MDVKNISKMSFNRGDLVSLFSLTSKSSVNKTVLEKVKDSGCSADVLQATVMINLSAEELRGRYIKFIAELPGLIKYKDKNLKDFFAIDKYTTLWWFSLISEKNTYKSDTFNRLAQLDATVSIIKEKKIQRVIFWCRSSGLEDALTEYTLQNSIRFEVLPVRRMYGFEQRILKTQNVFYLRHALFLLYFAMQLFLRIWRIKRNISGLKRSVGVSLKQLLLVTPYPNIDIPLAKKGIFKNQFYPYLQEALEAERRGIVWIAMYVGNNSMSFRDALGHARRFIKNGYLMFFLEEFSSVRMQLRSLLTMLKNGLRYVRIEKDVRHVHSFGDYNFYSLFKDDWYSSFIGHTGYQGILYYKMFASLLRKVRANKCLYLCEMHAWEKALISARETVGCTMPLYGYQSGTVSRMLLNYFNHPSEIIDDKPYSIPRPEKVICDGRLPCNYMRDSGWPEDRLSIVEAIRYTHLKKVMKAKCDKKGNIVLLVFSIGSEESSAILNVAYESLRDLKDIEVWIKAHPFLSLEKVFELSGISNRDICFKVKDGPIEDLLSEARMVIVGQSGVSVQALLYGCQVVTVNVPEWINISPLEGIKTRMVKTVDSPDELRQIVIDIFKEAYKPERYMPEAKEIVDEYFCLDQDSDIPDRFLTLLKSNSDKFRL